MSQKSVCVPVGIGYVPIQLMRIRDQNPLASPEPEDVQSRCQYAVA